MSAQRWLVGAWLGLLSGSCAGQETAPPTQAIVVVYSDLSVGEALTSIRAQVQSADGKVNVAEPFSFSLASATSPGRSTLPLSFGIARPADGAERFRVTVAGYGPAGAGGGETLLIEQKALVTFQDRRSLKLTVFLGGACMRKVCDASAAADSVCYPVRDGAVAAGDCGPLTAPLLHAVDPERELDGPWPGASVRDPPGDAGTKLDDDPMLTDPSPTLDGGPAGPQAWWSHSGVGYNELFQAGGGIAANLTIDAARLTGFMNLSELPGDPAPICGAGELMAVRQGSAVTGSFVSEDPDPGCGFDKGARIDVTGELAPDGSYFAGQYRFASTSTPDQPGVFEMWRHPPPPTTCMGTMSYTGGDSFPLSLTVLLGHRTISGRWDARDSRAGAVCSQGHFSGIRKEGLRVEFSFVHGDARPACSGVLGARQFQAAQISGNGKQLSGEFHGPSGTGTFRVECQKAL